MEKEKRYFAPVTTRRVAALPEDQSFWDRGVVSNQEVSEDIGPRVGSSHRFPGEFLKQQIWPVVKTTVTSPRTREMQVRVLLREFVPAWSKRKDT